MQKILRCEDEKNLVIDTNFSTADIEIAVEKIEEELNSTLGEDIYTNDQMLIDELTKRGYIKVLGKAPEIIELSCI